MRRWIRPLAAAAALVLAAAAGGAAAPREAPRRYLVGLRPGVAARDLGAAGAAVQKDWPALGAAAVLATPSAVARLQAHPGVEFVEEDRPVRALGFTDQGEVPWGVAAVRAPEAWPASTGAGIRVCIIDTGIDYNHPEFFRGDQSIVKGRQDFVGDRPDAFDGNGHGTHVAGTVAAQPDGAGVVGVAPGVDLYVARVLGDDGTGTTSAVINAVLWCADTVKAHVANLSLGSSLRSRAEERAFDYAYSKGMLAIAASGNDGARRILYPAAYRSVVAVGAVDSNLTLASFSNYGREQELVGPGVQVLSAAPLGTGRKASAAEDGVAYPANPVKYGSVGTVTGPLVECGLADSAASCQNPPAGDWVALISRGNITFAQKVQNVMAQGAKAAIITNNDTAHPDDPGSFTLGSAGDWIPTVSVSYNSGVAIRSGGLGTGTVSVAIWDYQYLSGTSMAAPHVTGVAALAWAANPRLSNAQVRQVLRDTALDLGARGWDAYYGYGLVQAPAAVQRAQQTR